MPINEKSSVDNEDVKIRIFIQITFHFLEIHKMIDGKYFSNHRDHENPEKGLKWFEMV